MDKTIRGKAFVVGDDIDTDQIIPAQHLSLNPAIPQERKLFGHYAMSGVPAKASGLPQGNIPFVEGEKFVSEFVVVIGGSNFGCGSSREHAPLAMAQAGVKAVVAQSYARIFYRNSINGGYLVPFETAKRLVEEIQTGDQVEIDTQTATLTDHRTGKSYPLSPLGDVTAIIDAGGIFSYAKKQGMLK